MKTVDSFWHKKYVSLFILMKKKFTINQFTQNKSV